MEDLSPLLELLERLRRRLWFHLALALLAFVAAFELSGGMLTWLRNLLLPAGAELIYLAPAEWLLLRMKLAAYVALVVVTVPIAVESWVVLRRRFELPPLGSAGGARVVALSLLLFTAGVAYSLGVVLPTVLAYLHGDAASAGLQSTYSLAQFYQFVMLLTLAMGIAFQLPLVMLLLLRLEVATVAQMREYRSHLIVLFFVMAALITPPDIISQVMLALPLLVLYQVTLLAAQPRGPARLRLLLALAGALFLLDAWLTVAPLRLVAAAGGVIALVAAAWLPAPGGR